MWLPEIESPTTGQGRRADSQNNFRRLTSHIQQYAPPPSLASVSGDKASKRAAIAWRYREAQKRRDAAVPPIVWLRLAELERIIQYRWDGLVPETWQGEIFVRVAVNHLVGFSKSWRKRVNAWCERCAPWLDEDVLDEIVDLAAANPTLYKADKLANVIELDIATRDLLNLKTIGASDLDAKARAARRLALNAGRKRKKRAERGAKPRADCTSQQKPWLAEGISRRTWYRRQREYSA